MSDIATRKEVLRILTEQAGNGSVTAAAALRLWEPEEDRDEVADAIDRILAEKRGGEG